MKVLREQKDGIAVLRLRGQLLGGEDNAEAIGSAIQSAVDEGHQNVLLDLGGISVINSTGVGILVVNYIRLKRNGGSLKLCGFTNRIHNVLMVTGLIRIFDCYHDEAEALAGLKS